ncbi:hypothetical protein KBY08_24705 [Pseudomonas sp. P135]|uniref:Uncharacterized protein n=1 Tax=Pseudomonas syringae UB303 TaxID=1357287 RepID=A0AAJ4AVV7_PSESX|nr:hypothetical protein [Pseudomonas sp. P129]MCA5974884.1 hypothetical protein [Pseudomonas sp. P135]QHF06052.1 hypothetical protein N026_00470 [Pseudomonas syringae UB303]
MVVVKGMCLEQDWFSGAVSIDYKTPLVESEIKGVKFDLLKCLDLYYSKALSAWLKEILIKPDYTYIQDNK